MRGSHCYPVRRRSKVTNTTALWTEKDTFSTLLQVTTMANTLCTLLTFSRNHTVGSLSCSALVAAGVAAHLQLCERLGECDKLRTELISLRQGLALLLEAPRQTHAVLLRFWQPQHGRAPAQHQWRKCCVTLLDLHEATWHIVVARTSHTKRHSCRKATWPSMPYCSGTIKTTAHVHAHWVLFS